MTRPRGSIVVNELILPIIDIRLVGGCVQFTAEVMGPQPAFTARNYTVHDESGGLVYRSEGGWEGRIVAPTTPPGEAIRVVAWIHFEQKVSRARCPEDGSTAGTIRVDTTPDGH